MKSTSVLPFIFWVALPVFAQSPPDLSRTFNKIDEMISARDGVRLHTEIYVPKKSREPLPFLITRTPYGQNLDSKGFNTALYRCDELAQDGYIFVFQDIRGRYKSEG